MKKILVIIATFILLIATGCTTKLKTYEKIDLNKFEKMISNKQSFILFIGSTECPHCKLYKVKLDEVIEKYQVKVYYIDVAKFSSEQTKTFATYLTYGGTPTTIFIKNGVEETTSSRIDGNVQTSKIIAKLEASGYIKD